MYICTRMCAVFARISVCVRVCVCLCLSDNMFNFFSPLGRRLICFFFTHTLTHPTKSIAVEGPTTKKKEDWRNQMVYGAGIIVGIGLNVTDGVNRFLGEVWETDAKITSTQTQTKQHQSQRKVKLICLNR